MNQNLIQQSAKVNATLSITNKQMSLSKSVKTHKDIDISVIIPVYNTEKYLKRCFNSVVANSKKLSIEVIVVDDESPDNSQDIINEYAQKYPFFRAFTQTWGKQGKARNKGLRQAQGKYVFFLDSDDLLYRNALYLLFCAAEKYQSDFVVGKALSFKGLRRKISGNYSAYKKTVAATDLKKSSFLIKDTSCHSKLFRRAFLEKNEITFPEQTFFEDVPFIYRAYQLADKITIIPKIVYGYRGRKAHEIPSVTQKTTSSKLRQCSSMFNIAITQYENESDPKITCELKKHALKKICVQLTRIENPPDPDSDAMHALHDLLQKFLPETIIDFENTHAVPLLMIKYGYFQHASALLNHGLVNTVIEDWLAAMHPEHPDAFSKLLKVDFFLSITRSDRIVGWSNNQNIFYTLKTLFGSINVLRAELSAELSVLAKKTAKLLLRRDASGGHFKSKCVRLIGKRSYGFIWKMGFILLRPIVARLTACNYWLVGERLSRESDGSGFIFFDYCREEHREEKIFFVLEKNRRHLIDDKYHDKTIARGSLQHFRALLKSSVFVFTNNELDVSPFYFSSENRFHIKTIFLGHGITYYNPAVHVRKIANRFSLIIACSEAERRQKLHDWNIKKPDKVAATGYPIFDSLTDHQSTNEILFCPTWRNKLDFLSPDDFKSSNYYEEIASFLSDPTTHSFLLTHGLTLTFRCHSRMSAAFDAIRGEFPDTIVFESNGAERKLQDVLKNTCLLITDYSSILWGMAYMGKPVLLYQFDRPSFLSEKGLHQFSMDESHLSFARIAHNKEEVHYHLSQIAGNDFRLTTEQKLCASGFFAFHDSRNNLRVYNKIKSISN